MNTKFTVTCHKGKETESAYSIDLGQDILDGVSEGDIRKLAGQALTIQVQGKLRKKDTETGIIDALITDYPNTTVALGVIREKSITAQFKALEKILGKDELAKLIEEQLEKNKG